MDDTKKTVGAIIPVPGNMLQAVLWNRFVDVDHLQSDWIMKGGLKVSSAIYLLDWNSRYLYGFFSVSLPPAVAHSEYGKMIRVSTRFYFQILELMLLSKQITCPVEVLCQKI